jgi:MscS family membrane protein
MVRLWLCLALVVGGSVLLQAQEADSLVLPVDTLRTALVADEPEDHPPFRDSLFATPYHTLYHFLYYLQDKSWQPEEAAKALAAVGLSREKRIERAIQLKKIIDGRGLFIYLDELPRSPTHSDTSGHAAIYRLGGRLPWLYLQRYGKLWLFAKRTVREIPHQYEQLYPWGIDRLIEPMARRFSGRFAGLHAWQWLLLGLVLVLGLLIYRLQWVLINAIVGWLLPRLGGETIGEKLIGPVSRPVSFLLVMGLFSLVVAPLQLPVRTTEWLVAAFKVINPLLVILIVYRLVGFLSYLLSRAAARTESTLDDQLVPLVRRVLKLLVVGLGLLYILDSFGYNITALVAGLSLGGLAVALAAQDALKNIFGSIMIFVDRPFQVGHWIIYDKVEGIVEEVGLRSTRVRTFYNSLVYVPNAKLADNVIDNMGLRHYRRLRTELGVQYDTPPQLLDAFTQGIIRLIEAHPHTLKERYEVKFLDFKDFSLNILVLVFFEVPTFSAELKARHELLLAILELAAELGVSFAFPTQTVHVENFPGTESLSKTYPLSAEEALARVSAFAARKGQSWAPPASEP